MLEAIQIVKAQHVKLGVLWKVVKSENVKTQVLPYVRQVNWLPSVREVYAHPSVKIVVHHGGGEQSSHSFRDLNSSSIKWLKPFHTDRQAILPMKSFTTVFDIWSFLNGLILTIGRRTSTLCYNDTFLLVVDKIALTALSPALAQESKSRMKDQHWTPKKSHRNY